MSKWFNEVKAILQGKELWQFVKQVGAQYNEQVKEDEV